MKATGVIRRIDDLGRVVIPKDVRQALKIREGDPLEVFVGDGMVCLRKYLSLTDYFKVIEACAKSLYQTTGCSVLITDTRDVIVGEGVYEKAFLGKELSDWFLDLINYKDTCVELGMTNIVECQAVTIPYSIIKPIVIDGDVSGSIIIASNKPIPNEELFKALLTNTASFIAMQPEK